MGVGVLDKFLRYKIDGSYVYGCLFAKFFINKIWIS